MKHHFLEFPDVKVNPHLPNIKSRRMHIGSGRHNIAYKSDGGKEEDEGEDSETKALSVMSDQVKKLADTLGDKADKASVDSLQAQIKTLNDNLSTWTGKQVTDAIEKINGSINGMLKQIQELQEKSAQEGETAAQAAAKGARKLFTSAAVKAMVNTLFPGGRENKGQGKMATLEIGTVAKAAENFAYATFFEGGEDTDITAFTGRFIDPILYQRRRKANLILDNFEIRTINVPTLVYLIKVEDGDDANSSSGDSGGVAWILPGEMKPKRSFRVTTGKVEAKKVAIFGTAEDELLSDVASLENWIREDMMDEMREEINDGLLNNDPAINPKAPLGLKIKAKQFSATPAFADKFATNTSNIIDQLIAASATMRRRRERPKTVFISDDLWMFIHTLKDSQQRYQNSNLIYTTNLGELFIAGVHVVGVDYEDIPSTHMLLIAADLGFKIYAYGPLAFETGLNGEDFRYDCTSYRAYQRFLTYIPEHRENSVMYDTLANIKTGIEA